MGVLVREKPKGSGQWYVLINHKGNRRSKKVGDRVSANKVAKEVRQMLAKGDLGMFKPKCPSLKKYADGWFRSPVRTQADQTLHVYRRAFSLHVEPVLGSMQLDEIKRKHVKEMIASMKKKGLGKSRMQAAIQALSGVLESAVEDETIHANPCSRTRKFCKNNENGTKKTNPLVAGEVEELLENAKSLGLQYFTLFFLGVRSGLRVSEMLALTWDDIDFEQRVVDVNKSWNYRLKKVGPPKNGNTRLVDLTPMTVEALEELKAKQKVVNLKSSRLVFCNGNGEPLAYDTVNYKLKKVAPRIISIHNLRHTYATLRIAKGDNILDVSKQLGHHSVGFTLDVYGHWTPQTHKAQVDELDNFAA